MHLFLNEMSEPTVGSTFQVGKKVPLAKIFKTMRDELRSSQYSPGYITLNRAHDGAFRKKLQVRVHDKGLRVQARKGYFAREAPKSD
jgi:hypothetical protein